MSNNCKDCVNIRSVIIDYDNKFSYGMTSYQFMKKVDVKKGDSFCYECFDKKNYKYKEVSDCQCISCGDLFNCWERFSGQAGGCAVSKDSKTTFSAGFGSKYDEDKFILIKKVKFNFEDKGKYICDKCVATLLDKKILKKI